MKHRILVALAILLGLGYVAGVVYATDPCQGTTAGIQIASIGPTASPGTYRLIAPQSNAGNNRRILVCGWNMTVAGTSPTVQFEEGPGAACSPAPTALTGTYAPSTGSYLKAGEAGQTVLNVDPGDGLCIVTGGTTPSAQGEVQFVVVP